MELELYLHNVKMEGIKKLEESYKKLIKENNGEEWRKTIIRNSNRQLENICLITKKVEFEGNEYLVKGYEDELSTLYLRLINIKNYKPEGRRITNEERIELINKLNIVYDIENIKEINHMSIPDAE